MGNSKLDTKRHTSHCGVQIRTEPNMNAFEKFHYLPEILYTNPHEKSMKAQLEKVFRCIITEFHMW